MQCTNRRTWVLPAVVVVVGAVVVVVGEVVVVVVGAVVVVVVSENMIKKLFSNQSAEKDFVKVLTSKITNMNIV